MSLRKWLGLCEHKWVEIERGRAKWPGTAGVGQLYIVYQCEHCKKLKEVSP